MADETVPSRPGQPTVVLVHGGFLGAWIWTDVVAGLDAEGISAGGAVITEAAAGPHPTVGRLVYLTAAVPDAGDTMASLMADAAGGAHEQPDAGAEPVVMRPDGLAELEPEQAGAALFHDCGPARAKAAVDRLRPMSMAGASQALTGAAWRELPATLVRGTLDRMPEAIAPAFFEHDPEVVEVRAGHCPKWSRPDLVADVLVSQVAQLDG